MSDCGHDERFIDWEDHSKPIVCLKCENKRLRSALLVSEHQVESHAELLNEFATHVQNAQRERDACRQLLREAVAYLGEVRTNEDGIKQWADSAARAAGGGDGS